MRGKVAKRIQQLLPIDEPVGPRAGGNAQKRAKKRRWNQLSHTERGIFRQRAIKGMRITRKGLLAKPPGARVKKPPEKVTGTLTERKV